MLISCKVHTSATKWEGSTCRRFDCGDTAAHGAITSGSPANRGSLRPSARSASPRTGTAPGNRKPPRGARGFSAQAVCSAGGSPGGDGAHTRISGSVTEPGALGRRSTIRDENFWHGVPLSGEPPEGFEPSTCPATNWLLDPSSCGGEEGGGGGEAIRTPDAPVQGRLLCRTELHPQVLSGRIGRGAGSYAPRPLPQALRGSARKAQVELDSPAQGRENHSAEITRHLRPPLWGTSRGAIPQVPGVGALHESQPRNHKGTAFGRVYPGHPSDLLGENAWGARAPQDGVVSESSQGYRSRREPRHRAGAGRSGSHRWRDLCRVPAFSAMVPQARRVQGALLLLHDVSPSAQAEALVVNRPRSLDTALLCAASRLGVQERLLMQSRGLT